MLQIVMSCPVYTVDSENSVVLRNIIQVQVSAKLAYLGSNRSHYVSLVRKSCVCSFV